MWAKLLSTPKYVQASTFAAIGGILFGFDTGIIGPTTTMDQYASTFGALSSTTHGAVVSSILIPAAITSFFAGHVSDRIGRVKAIYIGSLIWAAGAAVEAGAAHIAMFVIGRIIAGIGAGCTFSTITVYLCEITPAHSRGVLGSSCQFAVIIGVCAGYFACYGAANIGSSLAWRLPYMIHSIEGFLYTACAFFMLPESPRWLKSVGRELEASKAWETLGIEEADREKAATLEDTTSVTGISVLVVGPASPKGRKGFLDVFASDVWRPTMLGVFLSSMQQLGGIDGVLYYAPILFQQAGLVSSNATFLASGVSSLLMFAITLPAFLLADHWGRRTCTVVGGAIMAICMLLIGSLYAADAVHADVGPGRWLVIIAIFVYAITFSGTWSICIRIYVSEIQPARTRSAATSLAQGSNWVFNFLVALVTPIFLANSSSGAYFWFGAMNMLTVAICMYAMVETKGRRLEDIEAEFAGRQSRRKVQSEMDPAEESRASISDMNVVARPLSVKVAEKSSAKAIDIERIREPSEKVYAAEPGDAQGIGRGGVWV